MGDKNDNFFCWPILIRSSYVVSGLEAVIEFSFALSYQPQHGTIIL